jgi:transposase-like protein
VDEKVESVRKALKQINVAEAARQAEVPESTLRYDLDKLDKALPEVLVNQPPGPKPQQAGRAEAPAGSSQEEKPVTCPECGGQVKKNGTYWVLNWVLMLTMGWQGLQQVLIQRWRCKGCGHELISSERARQAEARQAWWQQVNRLIALSRFKLRLSVRLTQVLVKFVYARAVSVGHIERVTQRVGRQAKGGLDKLKQCRQAAAQFLLFDETFPKMKERGYSLGVAICEHGLIRSVRCLTHKAKEIPAQLADVVGEHFQPTYFLTDLDVLYHKYMQEAGLNLTHLRDKVHLIRQLVRLFEQAVRDVTLDVPKGLPLPERKKQRQLKRRLLRKQLQPLLALLFKAFSPGYEGVCVLILEGLIAQLQDPTVIIQTASVQTLSRRLQRFINKHGQTINLLLQLSVEQNTPTTTNSLESKNSLFKPFSRIAKFFPKPPRCETFFCGVALMENFDVKTRGSNKGTCAMQRAEINLEDFGATDFFSAVGLPEPQISLANGTYY